jgi:lipoate-protein ligase B
MHHAWLLNLPRTDYVKALELQHACVSARKQGRLDRDLVILLEHPPVFTLGRRGGLGNLLIPKDHLEQKGIDIMPIERGGDITYHGPGQLVGYLIIDLKAARMGIIDLVGALESAMADTARCWGLQVRGNERYRGAWVGNRKLGSIGLTIRRGITFHGMALNVNTDLTPFSWINPCGIEGCAMTSLAKETGRSISMEDVRRQLVRQVEKQLDMSLSSITLDAIKGMA